MPEGDPKDLIVAALLKNYDRLVRRNSLTAFQRRSYRAGPTLKSQPIWRKLRDIVLWCQARGIEPVHFVVAQFDFWETTRSGEDYPSPRYMGVTPKCIGRYERWCAKRRSLIAADVEKSSHVTVRTIDRILMSRPDLTEEAFFDDPLLVRLLPVDEARNHPVFQQKATAGRYADALASVVLRDYLEGYRGVAVCR